MSEFSSPALVDVDPGSNISTMLADRVARDPEGALAERRSPLDDGWTAVSARAFAAEVRGVAKGLVASGVEPGDRVAIMSRTRYEWSVLDFAIWAAGGVGVPVYETSSAEQVQWILSDSRVRAVVVETAAHAGVVDSVRAQLPELADVWTIDDGGLAALTTLGADVADDDLDRRTALAGAADLATIIYTSGTTGRPKGVELTHGNFVHLALNGAVAFGEICAVPGARTLIFMPLAHVFARYVQLLCVPSGAVIGYTPDPKQLLADLATFRPTFILAVPRVFEKVYNSAEQKAAASPVKLRLFRWAAKASIDYSRALETSAGPSPALRAQHALAGHLVHSKLRAALGGQATWAISGGAPLGERLGHFYRGIGLKVLEGYGLTETAAPTAVSRPDALKIGSVGPPFPGTSLRVDDDGEIFVKGPHVFRGYHDNAEATAEALADGWFRTGDLGAIDADGFLRITGRLKEIIVTAGGKNVAPAVLEDRLRGHPLVSQCVVVGDARPFIGALVTLDADMLPGWLSSHGLPEMDVPAAAKHPEVLAALDRAAERANEAVSRAESIRKIAVLPVDLTEANGYLTPSMKVKRAGVIADFTDEIEGLYRA